MIKERIIRLIEYKEIPKEEFYVKIGMTSASFRGSAKSTPLNSNAIGNILSAIPDVNSEWLLTGKGDMLKSNRREANLSKRKLIPFYDDITTFGGKLVKGYSANMEGISYPSEWIDTGDWFADATAAMRHYGDSMDEYPSGCILALKEIQDKQLIVWGKNYVIETDEFQISKRLQQGETRDYVLAYSSSKETYPDGRLVHEPIEIPVLSIRKLALVLGRVIKEQSSGMVYSIKNKK
jgi:hypothetical protein